MRRHPSKRRGIAKRLKKFKSQVKHPLVYATKITPQLEGCREGWVLKGTIQTALSINGSELKFNPITELPYQPRLKDRAKALRQAENLPEVLFLMRVIKRRFHKIDFERQRIIGNYIVDFMLEQWLSYRN